MTHEATENQCVGMKATYSGEWHACMLIEAAMHLIKAAKGPIGGPTSWTDTRDRWIERAESFLAESKPDESGLTANNPRNIDDVTKEILQLQSERDQMINASRAEKIAAIRKIVPDVQFHELSVYCTLIDHLPFQLNSDQYCTVLNIRRNTDGVIEFQVTKHGSNEQEWIEQGLLSYTLDMEDCE